MTPHQCTFPSGKAATGDAHRPGEGLRTQPEYLTRALFAIYPICNASRHDAFAILRSAGRGALSGQLLAQP